MSRNEKPTNETQSSPGPVPFPPPNRRSSFSQNPSFSTLFGRTGGGSPPRISPDAGFQRRFSWSYAPPKESSSAIDDTEEPTSPSDERRSEFGLGRRLSTTASSIREALGFKADEPTSPRAMKTSPFHQMKSNDATSVPSTGSSPGSSEGTPSPIPDRGAHQLGGDIPAPGRVGPQGFIQRRRASFGKSRNENDPHADRMLQGHFSID